MSASLDLEVIGMLPAGHGPAGGVGVVTEEGSQRSTARAPTSATAAAAPAARCMASRNAWRAGPTSPLSPSLVAASRVASRDSPAWCRAEGGSTASSSSMPRRYAAPMREPSTATPRAPPSWRTVLFIAEATPAFSRGIAFMMDTAAVGMTHATPAPSAANRTRISHTGACWVTKVTPQSDAVTASMPAAHTFRGPIERTRTVLSGPQTTFATASATVHPPACRGV